jgi:hypothetical protein
MIEPLPVRSDPIDLLHDRMVTAIADGNMRLCLPWHSRVDR